jgi:MscS family membrane protein
MLKIVLALRLALMTLFTVPFCPPSALAAQEADFSGDWQTFWRTGAAVLSLSRTAIGHRHLPARRRYGRRDRGGPCPARRMVATRQFGALRFRPVGRRSGSDRAVRQWRVLERISGGRRGWKQYLAARQWQPTRNLAQPSDRGQHRLYAGDAGALRQVGNLVSYAGPPASAGQEARRRTIMFDILDMSTLRIMDVPDAPETPGETTVRFAVGTRGCAGKDDA